MMPMMLLRPEEEKKKKDSRKQSSRALKSPGEVLHLQKIAPVRRFGSSGGSGPTCSHEEDAGTQHDVVPFAVDASKAHADAAHHEQDGAEDGEQAGRSDQTCSK